MKSEEKNMGNDLFGGLGGGLGGSLGGLVKGLSSIMPQDDPAVKMMNAQTEVSSLQKQEQDLYAEIGRKAVQMYGIDTFGDTANKLKLVQANLQTAQEALNATKAQQAAAKAEEDARRQAEEAAAAALRCPSCGHTNPEGTKFCQECGAKIGASACVSCGAPLQAGSRFCGECGARQPE